MNRIETAAGLRARTVEPLEGQAAVGPVSCTPAVALAVAAGVAAGAWVAHWAGGHLLEPDGAGEAEQNGMEYSDLLQTRHNTVGGR